MKILVSRPGENDINDYLAEKRSQQFSYSAVGRTRDMKVVPLGYTLDTCSVKLGEGEDCFDGAVLALRNWAHFDLGWVFSSNKPPIEEGSQVALLVTFANFWLLFSCRIVYVIDQSTDEKRTFGFAYGTMPDHPEEGEERFLIEWNRSDNTVSYEILAFSKPADLLTFLAYPLTRTLQKKFARESQSSMVRAVKNVKNQSVS